MLEKMGEFFDSRLDIYDEHQMTCIESADKFYPFTAGLLPLAPGAGVLDLGCGTGLELEEYFGRNPSAKIVGIDLAPGMLKELENKFTGRDITLILGSYFDVPFGHEVYDAAVSVESLHHFTKEEKIPLYSKLHVALKTNGYFVLTDYFALTDEQERLHHQELLRLKQLEGIEDGDFYHYDTPLTVEHETQALLAGGFSRVDVLASWGATHTLIAKK